VYGIALRRIFTLSLLIRPLLKFFLSRKEIADDTALLADAQLNVVLLPQTRPDVERLTFEKETSYRFIG